MVGRILWLYCSCLLCLLLCLSVRLSRIFRSHGETIIADKGLLLNYIYVRQHLVICSATTLFQQGSWSCHTGCDTGSRFFVVSFEKNRPNFIVSCCLSQKILILWHWHYDVKTTDLFCITCICSKTEAHWAHMHFRREKYNIFRVITQINSKFSRINAKNSRIYRETFRLNICKTGMFFIYQYMYHFS